MGEFLVEFMFVKVFIVVIVEECVLEVFIIVVMFGEVVIFFFWFKDKVVYVDFVRVWFIVKDGGDYLILFNVYN